MGPKNRDPKFHTKYLKFHFLYEDESFLSSPQKNIWRMFIEDSNLIKAPNHFILPFYGPPLTALLTFYTFIKPEMGGKRDL